MDCRAHRNPHAVSRRVRELEFLPIVVRAPEVGDNVTYGSTCPQRPHCPACRTVCWSSVNVKGSVGPVSLTALLFSSKLILKHLHSHFAERTKQCKGLFSPLDRVQVSSVALLPHRGIDCHGWSTEKNVRGNLSGRSLEGGSRVLHGCVPTKKTAERSCQLPLFVVR